MEILVQSSIFLLIVLLAKSVVSETYCKKYADSHCHRNANCIDILDNTLFVCTCKEGYTGDGRTYCNDFDKCAKDEDNVCSSKKNSGGCVDHDAPQMYKCFCENGYLPDMYQFL